MPITEGDARAEADFGPAKLLMVPKKMPEAKMRPILELDGLGRVQA